MDNATRKWARLHGFSYDRSEGGWVRSDGLFLARTGGYQWRWRVCTRMGGHHPTMQPPVVMG